MKNDKLMILVCVFSLLLGNLFKNYANSKAEITAQQPKILLFIAVNLCCTLKLEKQGQVYAFSATLGG